MSHFHNHSLQASSRATQAPLYYLLKYDTERVLVCMCMRYSAFAIVEARADCLKLGMRRGAVEMVPYRILEPLPDGN